jgi:hypothetical protein
MGKKITPSILEYFNKFRLLRPSDEHPVTTHQYFDTLPLSVGFRVDITPIKTATSRDCSA